MKITQRLGKYIVAGAASAALTMGVMTLSAPKAEAFAPILLCGPTFMWSCTGIGGPSILFIGTICDKNWFERKTGKICTPI